MLLSDCWRRTTYSPIHCMHGAQQGTVLKSTNLTNNGGRKSKAAAETAIPATGRRKRPEGKQQCVEKQIKKIFEGIKSDPLHQQKQHQQKSHHQQSGQNEQQPKEQQQQQQLKEEQQPENRETRDSCGELFLSVDMEVPEESSSVDLTKASQILGCKVTTKRKQEEAFEVSSPP